jgi:hypothetical protein
MDTAERLFKKIIGYPEGAPPSISVLDWLEQWKQHPVLFVRYSIELLFVFNLQACCFRSLTTFEHCFPSFHGSDVIVRRARSIKAEY